MRTGTVRHWAIGALLVVVAGAVVVAAMAAGRSFGLQEPDPEGTPVTTPPATPSPTSSPTPDVPEGFVEFVDRDAGIAIAYPSTWERIEAADPEIVLLATPNGRDSLLVRVTQLPAPVDERSLEAIKARADRAVASGRGVRFLAVPEQVTLGGAIGYFYFYEFRDADSGRTGAHSHYVLFEGDRMIALVFQALPKASFVRLAPVFDQIAATFRVL